MNTLHRTFILVGLSLAAIAAQACTANTSDDFTESVGVSQDSVASRPYFEVGLAKNGEHYFNMRAANHEVVLTSESYSSRTAALGGLLSVLDNGGERAQYELLEANNGQFYFNLIARNFEIIATSETFTTRSNAERAIGDTMANIDDYLAYLATRTGARFVVFEGADGYYFQLRAQNGAVVLKSESYVAEASALNGTFSVADNGTDPDAYDILEAKNGGFYFNLRARNHEIIGTSEIYDSRFNAERARDAVIDLLPTIDLL